MEEGRGPKFLKSKSPKGPKSNMSLTLKKVHLVLPKMSHQIGVWYFVLQFWYLGGNFEGEKIIITINAL